MLQLDKKNLQKLINLIKTSVLILIRLKVNKINNAILHNKFIINHKNFVKSGDNLFKGTFIANILNL